MIKSGTWEEEQMEEQQLKIVEVRCENCSKKIYVQEVYKRDKMFCTLGCMDKFLRNTSS